MEFTEEQVSLLKVISFEEYVTEIFEHCRQMFPVLVKLFDGDILREDIKQRIALAQVSGITQRGPVRLFIDMTIIFGTKFEHDLLYRWPEDNSQKPTVSQIEKSMVLYGLLEKYLDVVHGKNSEFFLVSVNRFYDFNLGSYSLGQCSTPKALHELLETVYPQKYNFISCDIINDLIFYAEIFSKKHEFSSIEHKAYITLVMFLFGSQFEQDVCRGHLIMDGLTSYLKTNNINNHLVLVSLYSCLQVNNK